jgi:hypothetical protein
MDLLKLLSKTAPPGALHKPTTTAMQPFVAYATKGCTSRVALIWMAAFCSCLLFSTGCATAEKSVPPATAAAPARSPIDELNILAVPVALNLDHLPGLDGFMIKIYPGTRKRPRSVPIESGQLEIFMYDGLASVNSVHVPNPRRVWTYTAADLKQFEIKTAIGTGYQLAPLWGEARPTRDKITVIARYTSPTGAIVASAPSVIAVGIQ